MKTVVGDQFESLLDKGKNADLLVGVEHFVTVNIKNTHELLYRTYLCEGVKLRLIVPEHYLQHFLSQVRSSHLVFAESSPNGKALGCTVLVALGLAFDLGDDCGVEGVEGVEGFGVEFDGRDCVAAV